MSYQVLARKWRPRHFNEMVGQEAILRILSNALTQNRLHHAYLFTGTRGVGKTTIARILAKCLNCEGGISATPCGTCQTCISIDQGQFIDLYEVDAASRTKVEDTRELLENVLYPPNQGRYKIYLIDEVHMLSNHSFNALLKTLEEPPAHVKFLLATTDPKRLPITILSRCLQFHLKRISTSQIAAHLQHICEQEKIASDTIALQKIAQAADGSMRDALSLLDQAIAYGLGTIDKENVDAMLGSISHEALLPLFTALARKDGKQLFAAIQHIASCGPDFNAVLEEFIHVLHTIAITQISPQALTTHENILKLSQTFTPEEIQLYYQIALFGRRDIALTPTPQQGFEMTMLRIFAFQPDTEGNELTNTFNGGKDINVLQKTSSAMQETAQPQMKQLPSQTLPSPAATGVLAKSTVRNEEPMPSLMASESTSQDSKENWRQMLPKLELSGMAYALASNCVLLEVQGDLVKLALSITHEPMVNQKLKERIEEALTRFFKRPMHIEISMTRAEIHTPVKQQLHEEKQQLKTATETILNNPHVKKLIEMYDATVDVSLLA